MTELNYPMTRTDQTQCRVAGIEFPDPYQWLESNTQEVLQWQAAQNCLADEYVQSWPNYGRLKTSVSNYLAGRTNAVPRCAGERWFRLGSIQNRSGIIISDTPYGAGRLVYSIEREIIDTPASIPWFSPSPDGQLLAVGICKDGSENNTIRLINVETGKSLPQPPAQTLMDGWMGGARWLPDNSGFYFQALVGEPEKFQQQILFHSIADGSQTQVQLPQQDPEGHDYILMMVSPDGRFHLAYQGLLEVRPIALRDTDQAGSQWQTFVSEQCSVTGHVIGNQLIAITNVNAPRGRVVAISLETETRGDPNTWIDLIPESSSVIRSITPVGDLLYISEFVDTYSRVRIFDIRGQLVGEVPLPGKGGIADEVFFSIQNLASSEPQSEYIFGFSSLSESWGVYRHRLASDQLDVLQTPQVIIDNAVVDDHWAISEDGTAIPYHSLRLANTDVSTPQPTLIYAYGGYNSARPPEYPGAMAAFVAAGGVYVLGNLRGGSEFGRDWWQGGRMKNKQNGFNDLYAIAEDLIDNHRTTPKLLAVNGRSNGGLMSGVAFIQRPELWNAVVPQVPLLDLVGALHHSYNRYCVEIELADPDDSSEVTDMLAYSPYHLIQNNTHYPAIFLDAGATDPRCPPWHARKFAARLQAIRNKSDAPVLLRVWENSGHGQATGRESLISQYAHWLAFVMRQLGVEPLASPMAVKEQLDAY